MNKEQRKLNKKRPQTIILICMGLILFYSFGYAGVTAISVEELRKKYITKEQWRDWVKSVWWFRSVQKNDDHPAKYPPELIARFVQMFSFPGDTV